MEWNGLGWDGKGWNGLRCSGFGLGLAAVGAPSDQGLLDGSPAQKMVLNR